MADAPLTFDLLGRDRSASKTFNSVGKSADNLGSKLQRAGKHSDGFGSKLKKAGKAGVIGLAVVGVSLAAIGPGLMGVAANIELMGKKADTVFGSQIGKVKSWARENAQAMGLTSREATGLAANFADLLIPMGFSRREAAGMSTDVIGLSGALAEWSGGQRTAAEVSESLAKAMLGEREELKGLGISISEADVQQRLMKKGQEELTGAALAQAEAIATQELILEKSTDAQAAYAKGSGTLARKLAEAKAQFRTFGETLLVAVTPMLKSFAGWLTDSVMPALVTFAEWFAGPGKFVIADWFLGVAEGAIGFAKFVMGAFKLVLGSMLNLTEGFLNAGAILVPSLRGARDSFADFANGVRSSMGAASATLDNWDNAVGNMRDEVRLKADISDLQAKVATARKELKDPDLTKTREAKLRAEIGRLLAGIGRAEQALNAFDGTTATGYLNLVRTITTLGGSGGSTAGLPLPATERAHGGPVAAGRAYLVGERRAEIFVPRQSGTILPDASAVGAGMPSPREYATALVRELRAAGLTLVAVDSGRRADLLGRAG